MAKKVVATCDFPLGPRETCGKDNGVLSASIMLGNKDWEGDLCREHQEPFQVLLRPNRKKTDREKVWTMEEIEALRDGG